MEEVNENDIQKNKKIEQPQNINLGIVKCPVSCVA
jgi:hypothetical protein